MRRHSRETSLQPPSALLFVAGGIGITPWADVLATGASSGSTMFAGQWGGSVSLVWVVRHHEEYVALARSLQVKHWIAAGVVVRVFITQPQAPECLQGHTTCGEADLPDAWLLPSHRELDEPATTGTALWHSQWVMAFLPLCACGAATCGPSLVSRMYSPSAILVSGPCADWPADASLLVYGFVCRGGAYSLAVASAAGATLLVALTVSLVLKALMEFHQRKALGVSFGEPLHAQATEDPRHSAGTLLVTAGRPDMRLEFLRAVGCSADVSLHVRVCGPKPLLAAAQYAASASSSDGFHVQLEVEDSDW